MKITSFLAAGLIVASCGLVATGCNDNPTDNTPGTTTVPTATSLKATSLSETSVKLSWSAPNDTALTGFLLSWSAVGTVDSSSTTVTKATTTLQGTTVGNLKAGVEYKFYVRSMEGTNMSSAVTINWAGAARYSDATALNIRMYEKSSTQGSGLLLDPTLGGPRMASAASEPANIQLIWLYKPASDPSNASGAVDSVIIGSPTAFLTSDFQNQSQFYKNTYISNSTFYGMSLDDIYPSLPLDQLINTSDNTLIYTIPAPQQTGVGQGFYLRLGSSTSDYHYARIFIRNPGTSLVQGSGTDHYLSLDISYQKTANLPFAKTAGGAPKVGFYAHHF